MFSRVNSLSYRRTSASMQLGSADPVDGALDLVAVGGIAAAGLQICITVDGGDLPLGILVHAGALDNISAHQTDFAAAMVSRLNLGGGTSAKSSASIQTSRLNTT